MQEKPKVAAVKAVVFNTDGNVLVLWKKNARLFRSASPASHDLPGGKVEPTDENAESAAAREIIEETGLHANVIRPHVKEWTFERDADVLAGKTFAALHVGGSLALSGELERHEWRDPANLADAPQWLRDDVQKALAVHRPAIDAYKKSFKKR